MLPKLSKDSRLLINDVLHCLLNTIDSNNFDNKHESNLNVTSDNRKLSTELSDTFIRVRGKTESEIHKSKSRTTNNPTNKYGSQPRVKELIMLKFILCSFSVFSNFNQIIFFFFLYFDS